MSYVFLYSYAVVNGGVNSLWPEKKWFADSLKPLKHLWCNLKRNFQFHDLIKFNDILM